MNLALGGQQVTHLEFLSLSDSSLLENKEKTVIHLFVCKVPGECKTGSSVLREEILILN